jgi:3-oxoacyl-(acyl-carrier-protein) synthase
VISLILAGFLGDLGMCRFVWRQREGVVYVLSLRSADEPVVITGIGMIASVGSDRESVWRAVRQGASGIRRVRQADGLPDCMSIAALADLPVQSPGRLKVIGLALAAAAEALDNAGVDFDGADRDRFGCAISGHMGDEGWFLEREGRPVPVTHEPWWRQWLPNTGCSIVANRFGLYGPRLCHSTACASGLIDVLAAVRAIQAGQCDAALAGSAEAIHPLFAAGFHAMRVLAQHDDPRQAYRPFDRGRSGFVLGEGAAMFVLERASHARRRGAKIYCEITAGRMLAEAHHVTGLEADGESLARLISVTLDAAGLGPRDVGYINAHGTGTVQNDPMEIRAIRGALGRAADGVWISSTKSMLGHLVNAAGSVELAITALALRDGFAPPTINLTDPDPQCDLDCIPLVGRRHRFEHALKLSAAFGGHLVAVALKRWEDDGLGYAYPRQLAA